MRVIPPSARYSKTTLACCTRASGRARIEFSICTMAGPGRLGVGVGVAGAVLEPQAASSSPRPPASVDPSRFNLRMGAISMRNGDGGAHARRGDVKGDVAARNAQDADPGRAFAT